MRPTTRGLCQKCRSKVPADHVIRDGKVFLRKDCPDCGATETLLSSDVEAWQRKRDLWHYDAAAADTCAMNCDRCGISHEPTIVFVDLTNRCNMLCPICIANVRGMGFDFHPPMDYFEKIFQTVSRFRPTPMLELFGGEPTVREDLVEIVKLARRYGLKSRVVTNGLRLADEEYCRKLCETGIRFRVAFDGRDPAIYSRLRRNPGAYEKKLKALENLRKYSRRKNAILCCAARKINEDHMGDLLDFCHEHLDSIDTLGLIPLAETWESGTFEESDVQTTREDVEHMIERCVVGGDVDFVPAGVAYHLQRARSFFRPRSQSEYLMLGGVHPDCETLTLLVSNGRQYESINHYLRVPLRQIAEEILERSRRIEPKLAKLDTRRRLHRWRGQAIVARAFGPLFWRAFDRTKLFKGNAVVATLRILAGLIRGTRFRDLAYRHLNPPRVLRVVVLPFEEYYSIDASRLRNCKAVFAYENVDTGKIETVPLCVWGSVYRNDILRRIAGKYGKATRSAGPGLPIHDAAAPPRPTAEPKTANH